MAEKQMVFAVAVACVVVFFLASGVFCEPELEVTGIFVDAQGNFAMVNDEILREGDTVEGARVVKITEDGVIFEYEGQENLYRVRGAPKKNMGNELSAGANISGGSSVAYTTSSSGKKTPMKTLYGMPIEKFFPSKEEVMRDMQPMMPATRGVSAAEAERLLQSAQDAKSRADAKREETMKRVQEMEGE